MVGGKDFNARRDCHLSWKPRLPPPPPPATTAIETTTTKVHEHRFITDQAGRQFAGRVPTYLPTYLLQLPTINCYLPAQRLLPTNSFCSFTTTTTPVAWNFLNNKKNRKKLQQQQNSKIQKFHNWSSCSNSFSLGVKFRQNLKNKKAILYPIIWPNFQKKQDFFWTPHLNSDFN